MKIEVIVAVVGIAAFALGYVLRFWLTDGAAVMSVLCALVAIALVSAAVLAECENGKNAVLAYFVFLGSLLSLTGFLF